MEPLPLEEAVGRKASETLYGGGFLESFLQKLAPGSPYPHPAD